MSGREHKLKFLPDETILFPKIVKVIVVTFPADE